MFLADHAAHVFEDIAHSLDLGLYFFRANILLVFLLQNKYFIRVEDLGMRKIVVVFGFCLTFSASSAAAFSDSIESLSKETYVTERLVAARVADVVRKNCDTIKGRMVFALNEAYRLRDWALDQGYSEAVIRAFLKDDVERARIYELADARFSQAGSEDDPTRYCKVGNEEIDAGSIAGSLLRR